MSGLPHWLQRALGVTAPAHAPFEEEARDEGIVVKKAFYIAGPMTHIEGFNYAAFKLAEQTLLGLGYPVLSPAGRVLDTDSTMPYHLFVRYTTSLLVRCENILLLPGWIESSGASMDALMAVRLQMKFYQIDLHTLRISELSRERISADLMRSDLSSSLIPRREADVLLDTRTERGTVGDR